MRKSNINIAMLIKLKELGMSDRKITMYLREIGIIKSETTINRLITNYYDSKGKPKPKKEKFTDIVDIKRVVKLKEEGMSDREIAQHFSSQGIKISRSSINIVLRNYYDSIGKSKSKRERYTDKVDIKELVKLKEEGMSDREITEYLREKRNCDNFNYCI